jgi:hypothetical protein
VKLRRAALKTMPRKLHDAFKIILDRIRRQTQTDTSLGMNILQWVFLATRELTMEELRHALSSSPDDTELDKENFLPESEILSSCLGLITVGMSDKGVTVRLVHKSLQDYFEPEYEKGYLFDTGHNDITVTCLRYMALNYPLDHGDLTSLVAVNTDLEPELLSLAKVHPQTEFNKKTIELYDFLDYAACNWCYHVKSLRVTDIRVRDMAIEILLNPSMNYRCISQNLRSFPVIYAHTDSHFKYYGPDSRLAIASLEDAQFVN